MQVMFFNYVCLDSRGLSATTPTCLTYLGDPSAVAAAATDSVTCGVLFSGTWFVLKPAEPTFIISFLSLPFTSCTFEFQSILSRAVGRMGIGGAMLLVCHLAHLAS